MSDELKKDSWVWVVIENPENNPGYLGQHDTTNDIKFLPVFKDKESALMCLNQFAKNDALAYEPQAVNYEDVMNHAKDDDFIIYLLNNKGEIIEKIDPAAFD